MKSGGAAKIQDSRLTYEEKIGTVLSLERKETFIAYYKNKTQRKMREWRWQAPKKKSEMSIPFTTPSNKSSEKKKREKGG